MVDKNLVYAILNLVIERTTAFPTGKVWNAFLYLGPTQMNWLRERKNQSPGGPI